MNEGFLLTFKSDGQPLNVASFRADQGILFEWHRDASPLILALGIQPLSPGKIEPVLDRHGWKDKQFFLDAVVEAGGIRFSGFQGDADGLPPGLYDLTVEVESMRFRDSVRRIEIREGRQTTVTLNEKPDRRTIRLRDNIDPLTAQVINEPRSVIDRQPLSGWLANPQPRAARQACPLNVLARLGVPPDARAGFTQPLTPSLDFLYFADVDRVYAAARAGLGTYLDSLVAARLWVKEGRPVATLHERLLDSLAQFGVDEATRARFALNSFRQGGRNCLQICVASPPEDFASRSVYLDIDIDLGNPFWDLEGLFVHLGEFLDPAKTGHLARHRALNHGATKDFLCYDVVRA